ATGAIGCPIPCKAIATGHGGAARGADIDGELQSGNRITLFRITRAAYIPGISTAGGIGCPFPYIAIATGHRSAARGADINGQLQSGYRITLFRITRAAYILGKGTADSIGGSIPYIAIATGH